MNNSIEEIIDTPKRLEAEIEWDYSLEYCVAIDDVIEILKEHINGRRKEENRQNPE